MECQSTTAATLQAAGWKSSMTANGVRFERYVGSYRLCVYRSGSAFRWMVELRSEIFEGLATTALEGSEWAKMALRSYLQRLLDNV